MTPPSNPQSRRTLLLGAGLAAVAGLATSWWVSRSQKLSPQAQQALAQHQFTLIDGQTLNLTQWQGHPMVLNFWATWCPPCVEEMPLLDAFYRQNSTKGWKMLGIAIDQPSQVKRFLGQRPVSYDIAFGGLDGTELLKNLGNEAGSLPFSLVLAADGQLIMSKMGKLSSDDLQKWA